MYCTGGGEFCKSRLSKVVDFITILTFLGKLHDPVLYKLLNALVLKVY